MVSYHSSDFSLEIDGASVGIILDGVRVAKLDVRSAVHQLNDKGETVRDEEPDLPVLTDCVKTDGGTDFIWKGKSSLWEEKRYILLRS